MSVVYIQAALFRINETGRRERTMAETLRSLAALPIVVGMLLLIALLVSPFKIVEIERGLELPIARVAFYLLGGGLTIYFLLGYVTRRSGK